jgi:imidazole glycerol phosphate synthase subunit HisF
MTTHQSDSHVQRAAEAEIIAALATSLDVPLSLGGTVTVSGGARLQLDARSEDGSIAVEAYARQGRLKGGQIKKIAQDVLKLALLRHEAEAEVTRPIVVFASQEARSSITGWIQHAADTFGVELHVVDIDPELRDRIIATQDRQKMVNVPLPAAADDIAVDDRT